MRAWITDNEWSDKVISKREIEFPLFVQCSHNLFFQVNYVFYNKIKTKQLLILFFSEEMHFEENLF